MMSRCGINCQHFLVRWSFGQQEPMSPEGIFSFTEPLSSRKHHSAQTTGTFKIEDNQRNAIRKLLSKVYLCFLFVFNDFRALMARVQSFWGLIWHWSDVWPCCHRHCRSKWDRNWPTCVLLHPKPPSTGSDAIMEAHWRCSCVKIMHQSTWTSRLGRWK